MAESVDIAVGRFSAASQSMNWKIKAGIGLVVVGALVYGCLALRKQGARGPVSVTLRLAITPAEQVGFVTGRANSAQFKYLMGKQSGVKPVLAQKLSLKRVPQSALVEARVGLQTKDEAQRYVDAFVPTLQFLCGQQAQLTLAGQSIR